MVYTFLHIQEEYKTEYLVIVGILNNVTDLKVTQLCRNSSQIVSDWSSRRGGSIYTAAVEEGGANWRQIETVFAVGAYSWNFTIVKRQVLVSKYNFDCKCFVLDFERHDDDELGFRKNDIITIISQKDEHCWVGELNGLRGENITLCVCWSCDHEYRTWIFPLINTQCYQEWVYYFLCSMEGVKTL